MLKIRLARIGKKNSPRYRVVISDHTKTPTSKSLEILGEYNPATEPATIKLKEDRVKYWISQGVQYSDTIGDILNKKGFIKKERIKYTSKHPKKSLKIKEQEAKAAEEKSKQAPKKEAVASTEKPAAKPETKPTEAKPDAKKESKPDKPKPETKK